MDDTEKKAKIGAAVYTRVSDMAKVNYAASVDYGKWLVATLFLFNGGMLGALNSRIDSTTEVSLFTVAISSSLALGLSLWWHFQLHFLYWSKLQNEALVVTVENLPSDRTPSPWIMRSFWLSLTLGVVSASTAIAALIFVLTGPLPPK